MCVENDHFQTFCCLALPKSPIFISDPGSINDLHRVKSEKDGIDIDTLSVKSADSVLSSIEVELSSNQLPKKNPSPTTVDGSKNSASIGSHTLKTDQLLDNLEHSIKTTGSKKYSLFNDSKKEDVDVEVKCKRPRKGLQTDRKLEIIPEEVVPDPVPNIVSCDGDDSIPYDESDKSENSDEEASIADSSESYDYKYALLDLFVYKLFGLNHSGSNSQIEDSENSSENSDDDTEILSENSIDDTSIADSHFSNYQSEDQKSIDLEEHNIDSNEIFRKIYIGNLKPGIHQAYLPYSVKVSRWQCLKENVKHQFCRIFKDQWGFMRNEIMQRKRTVEKGNFKKIMESHHYLMNQGFKHRSKTLTLILSSLLFNKPNVHLCSTSLVGQCTVPIGCRNKQQGNFKNIFCYHLLVTIDS